MNDCDACRNRALADAEREKKKEEKKEARDANKKKQDNLKAHNPREFYSIAVAKEKKKMEKILKTLAEIHADTSGDNEIHASIMECLNSVSAAAEELRS